MSTAKTLETVSTAISIVQLSQMAISLMNSIKTAAAAGATEVSTQDVLAAFAENDQEMALLRASIDRAKAEGR